MAQSTPIDKMNPSQITEEFRLTNQAIGKQRENEDHDPQLARRSDELEQEILRRMAW